MKYKYISILTLPLTLFICKNPQIKLLFINFIDFINFITYNVNHVIFKNIWKNTKGFKKI